MNISAVIVSYNSEKFLHANLLSLVRQTYKFREIVIVDNHSSDHSLEVISHFKSQCRDKSPDLISGVHFFDSNSSFNPFKSFNPVDPGTFHLGDDSVLNSITVLALPTNEGYSRSANIGIKHIISHSDSDLILVGNADIILDEYFNERVIGKFENERDLALLSPLILRFDGKTVDSAGQACSRTLHPSEIGYNKPLDVVDISEKGLFSVCGAATVFSPGGLERLKLRKGSGNDESVEYYDEDFFMFWEDFDIGWRATLFGLSVRLCPEAIVYHYRSGTLKRSFISRYSLALSRPPFIKYHLVKNRYLALIKNFHFKTNFKNILFIFLKDIIWVSLLTLSSPKIIIQLMKSKKYVIHAIEKRKQITSRITSN